MRELSIIDYSMRLPLGLVFVFLRLLLTSSGQVDCDSLVSFYRSISASSPPLNWSSPDCCQWEGVACTASARVTRLSLPGRSLTGAISPSLANLTFISDLNLSRNQLSGPLPVGLFRALNRLQSLDLSSNRLLKSPHLSDSLPPSIRNVDLSNNHFNGSIHTWFLQNASALISFNVSNNSFTGPLPSSICTSSPLLRILDFSHNEFDGHIMNGFGRCSILQVFRAGFNSLSGWLPNDLYSVTSLKEISLPNNKFSGPIANNVSLLVNLTILELQFNELNGEIPSDIGRLSSLEQLQLHTNNLTSNLPPSLAECSSLKTLLLRNNHLGGEISVLDFSQLQRLEAVDLGNNSFVGGIPSSLCLCRSLTALRLAYNRFVGEVPPCMASLKSLSHFSLSDNIMSNVVGALKILRHCDDLAVLFMSRCFNDEPMPDDDDLLHLDGFQNLQIFTLGGCNLKGQIPSWISKLRKLKVLNLSYNKITGPIPTWLGSLPSLFVLNLTENSLTGSLPSELGRLPALITDKSSSDLSYLALPFLFDSLQYNRLFNLPRGLKVGFNNLSGQIPDEIGQLKLLHLLDLNNNSFNGSIPKGLSGLVNLERLDMSGNHLSGEIPQSLTALHFLSAFSVADNDLQGQIPTGGQFDTFPAASFEGNPRLCGYVVKRDCPVGTTTTVVDEDESESESESEWYVAPFGTGYMVGFFAVSIPLLFLCS